MNVMSRYRLFVALAALAVSRPALAETCPEGHPVVPDHLEAWMHPAPLIAATDGAELEHAVFQLGESATVRLAATPDVRFAHVPEKPGDKVSSGGMVTLDVPATGTYRIMLGNRVWLDVVQEGQTVASTQHQHGPECSGIVKMVDFPLKAGHAVLQFSGSGQRDMQLMVDALP